MPERRITTRAELISVLKTQPRKENWHLEFDKALLDLWDEGEVTISVVGGDLRITLTEKGWA